MCFGQAPPAKQTTFTRIAVKGMHTITSLYFRYFVLPDALLGDVAGGLKKSEPRGAHVVKGTRLGPALDLARSKRRNR